MPAKKKKPAAKSAAQSTKRAATAPKARKAETAAAKKAPAKKTAPKKPAAAKAPSYEGGKWAAAFMPRAPGERRYWLLKSEPSTFSFDDLQRAPNRTTFWDGVRNFVARNFLRDGMQAGDRAFFYHSSVDPQAIVGVCEIARAGYPDATALDPKHDHFDADSDPANPTWYMVDVRAVGPLARPVTLPEIKGRAELSEMTLLRIGRLSVTPVTAKEWSVICTMGGGEP